MIADSQVDQYAGMTNHMPPLDFQYAKAPGSKAGQGQQKRPPSAGIRPPPHAQTSYGPAAGRPVNPQRQEPPYQHAQRSAYSPHYPQQHPQAHLKQQPQEHPGQSIPRPQTAAPRPPTQDAYPTAASPSRHAGISVAPRGPQTRTTDMNGPPPQAGRKTPSQARPPSPSSVTDWPSLQEAHPRQTSQGRGGMPTPRTSGPGPIPRIKSTVGQPEPRARPAAQAVPVTTSREDPEPLGPQPTVGTAYHADPQGPRKFAEPGRMTPHEVPPQNAPKRDPPDAVGRLATRENAAPAEHDDSGHTVDHRFRPSQSSHSQRTLPAQSGPATRQIRREPELSGMAPQAEYPDLGSDQAQDPVDNERGDPPLNRNQTASNSVPRHARSKSDAAPQIHPTAHRGRSQSTSAYDGFHGAQLGSDRDHCMEIDPETELIERARRAATVKTEKLKDMERQLKRLEADHEHLVKQRELLEAKVIEDEQRYLELRREADQHRHAAIVAVGSYQKARQDFSAKVSASGAQCQAKIAELEKHLEAVRRDRDEALSTARVLIEQFRRDVGADSMPVKAEIEIDTDIEGNRATAPGSEQGELSETGAETGVAKDRPLRHILEESTERARRALEAARGIARLNDDLERKIDEGKKVQDRLADELAEKDQMIQNLKSTQTAIEAVTKQLQENIEQQVKGSEARIQKLESECEKLKAERDQALSAYQTEYAAEQTKHQATENRLKDVETELSKYSKLFEKYETDFDELDDEDENGSDAEALGRAIERRLKELEAARGKEIGEMQKKLEEAEGKLQKTMEEKRAQIKEFKRELKEQKSALATAKEERSKQIELLEERLRTVEHEKAEVEEKLSDATDELADLNAGRDAEKNKPKSDEAVMRALRNNLEMAEAKIAFLESEHPAALGSGLEEYGELVEIRLKLRDAEEDLQTKTREIEVLQKRIALSNGKSVKDDAQALEIEQLKNEVAEKARIIQEMEDYKSTQGAGALEPDTINGQTVLERWQSGNLTAVETELVRYTAKETEGNWARKNAEYRNRIKKLENSAKADEARIKKQEEEQKSMMARYEAEIRSLKAQIGGQARLTSTENGHDSSASLCFSVGGNETNDKDQDPDTVEKVLEPTMDLFAVPDSLPVSVATCAAAQSSPSPPTGKGTKRKVDALAGTSMASNHRSDLLIPDKSTQVLVDSTPLEGGSEGPVNKKQIKKTRSHVEQEVDDGDWHPEERSTTLARNKKKTTKAAQSGVKRTGTRGQRQPSVKMPIATQNPAHLRRAEAE